MGRGNVMENLELYLLCLAIAVMLIGACHLPNRNPNAYVVTAAAAAIAGLVAAIVALIGLVD